jgi:N-acetylglutamate synthase-like GNAT family acetyltransferase
MLEYNIRSLKDDEIIQGITTLYSSFDRALPKDIRKEELVWKALKSYKIGNFLIVEENNKIIGIGGVFLFNRVCSFGYMGILRKFRGRGLGTALFGKLFNIAKDMNCESMFLYASELGKPIYHKFGFQESYYTSMHYLKEKELQFDNKNNKLYVIEKLPKWLLNLDKKAIGFDRRIYLQMKINLGSKIIIVENEGYGLLTNDRLGPLVALNQDAALSITKKSMIFGANHIIIPTINSKSIDFLSYINSEKDDKIFNLKMVYGKEISQNTNLLYAIGTYAKG